MRRCLYLILLLITPCALAGPMGYAEPDAVGMSSSQLNHIDSIIKKAINDKQTPGAVILIARRGKIVFRKAYGNKTLQPIPETMKVDTIFDMASLTKVMATAPSIMMLVEEGKLALSDHVADYLPNFAKHNKDKITVKQLMTHYSGLPPSLELNKPWSSHETGVNMAFDSNLAHRPGEKFVYSDINYIVAAELVRVISGETLDNFARKQIFQPLGMVNTTFKPDLTWQPRIAPTEKRDGVWLRGKVHDETTDRMGGVSGQAGVFSSADDTAMFAQMILERGQYHGIRILHPHTVAAMIQNQAPDNAEAKRGIGFDISSPYSTVGGDLFSSTSFGHTGYTGTSMWIDPDSQTIVILLTNRVHPDGEGYIVKLRKRLANVVASSIVD